MQMGLIGLGKMGASMAMKLCRADIHVVGFDAAGKAVDGLQNEPGFDGAYSLDALLNAVSAPRILWLMLPAGEPTERLLDELQFKLTPGDLLVNGANNFYKASVAHAARFRDIGIQFVDAGVTGGIHGLKNGYCIMAGGESTAIKRIERVLNALSPQPNQWLHCGPSGSGHFVKMVHNGIEYGMMQAYAEGFSVMTAKREFDLDIGA
ncbi:MAG: NAD(P)-binding domain-containing protein, partial [Betaproteobacteria bacterium]